jgi:hypothetical protein
MDRSGQSTSNYNWDILRLGIDILFAITLEEASDESEPQRLVHC